MSARASRRQVLAMIALADLPQPVGIDFNAGRTGDHLQLVFDGIEEAKQWGPLLGIPADEVDRADNTHRYVNGQGEQVAHFTAYVRPWRGWRVLSLVSIEVQAPDAPLDEATREQLAAVAQDGAAC